MPIQAVFTKADFLNFFRSLPTAAGIGSYYNNSFPHNCLYYERNTAQNIPIYTSDCWNLLKASIWGDLTLPPNIGDYWYLPGKYGLQDWNGKQILDVCTDVASCDIDSPPEPAEYLITRDYGHVGLFVGSYDNGTHEYNVVECTPIWEDGIQYTWMDPDGTRRRYKGGPASTYWAWHGKLPWVDYSDTPPTPPTPDPPDPPDPPSPEPEVSGKNINVIVIDKKYVQKLHLIRDGSGTATTVTATISASGGDTLIDFEEVTP